MGVMFYLIGKSSSGKDTIYKELLKDKELSLSPLVLYTTRPVRSGEKEGTDYHFIDDEALARLHEEGRVIEMREYNTVHGIWRYATVDDGAAAQEAGALLTIGTLESFKAVRKYFGEEKVIPVYIYTKDTERLMRAVLREAQQETPCCAEVCRRFLADEADFSADKLADAGITRSFQNDDLTRCLEEIRVYIFSYL